MHQHQLKHTITGGQTFDKDTAASLFRASFLLVKRHNCMHSIHNISRKSASHSPLQDDEEGHAVRSSGIFTCGVLLWCCTSLL